MAETLVKKVQGGYRVDGLDLLRANCGCGGLTGPGGSGVGDCCHTYSIVRQENNTVSFFAKATTPNTRNNYEWGYRVKKGPVEVDVLVYDTRNPKTFKFGGHYPPPFLTGKTAVGKSCNSTNAPCRGSGPNCLDGARVRRPAFSWIRAWNRSPGISRRDNPGSGRQGTWLHKLNYRFQMSLLQISHICHSEGAAGDRSI
jgi:hypothetical protein